MIATLCCSLPRNANIPNVSTSPLFFVNNAASEWLLYAIPAAKYWPFFKTNDKQRKQHTKYQCCWHCWVNWLMQLNCPCTCRYALLASCTSRPVDWICIIGVCNCLFVFPITCRVILWCIRMWMLLQLCFCILVGKYCANGCSYRCDHKMTEWCLCVFSCGETILYVTFHWFFNW